MAIRYQDKNIVLDDDGITIHWYYFPFGSKRLHWADIRKVSVEPMGVMTGKYRIWGTSLPQYWLHLDLARPAKDKAIVLETAGWVKPVITPDDVDSALRVIQEKTGLNPG
jgi:hypothetical protein